MNGAITEHSAVKKSFNKVIESQPSFILMFTQLFTSGLLRHTRQCKNIYIYIQVYFLALVSSIVFVLNVHLERLGVVVIPRPMIMCHANEVAAHMFHSKNLEFPTTNLLQEWLPG